MEIVNHTELTCLSGWQLLHSFLSRSPAQVLCRAYKTHDSHSYFDVRAGSKHQGSQRMLIILSQRMCTPYFRMQMNTDQEYISMDIKENNKSIWCVQIHVGELSLAADQCY